MRSKNPSTLFQDDIKLQPNLTLNLGLRWEVHGDFSEVNYREGIRSDNQEPVTGTLGAIWFDPSDGRSQPIATVYNARPFPQYLNIGPSVPGGLTGSLNNISNYDSLQLRLHKHLGSGS